MSGEIALSAPSEIQPNAPEASSDHHLIALWLHGRSPHTQRAYLADVDRFCGRAGKTFASVTLSDLQDFAASLEDLAPATRYRALSAVKSLLALGHPIGYLPFDVGRVLRLPSFRNRLSERILPEADVHRMLSLEADNRNRPLLTCPPRKVGTDDVVGIALHVQPGSEIAEKRLQCGIAGNVRGPSPG